MVRLILAAAVTLSALPAFAWNALGHKVIADIAWQQLTPQRRGEIVGVLRRLPRYDDDFAKQMPGDVDADRWTFQQAATWPDVIRGNAKYDNPTWHYVDFPIYLGPERPVDFNRDLVIRGSHKNWNVAQGVAYARKVLAEDGTPQKKALAYCWLLHLVGDLHQPCHSTALVCDRFPNGDRGGNSIPLVQGDNLHSLWDNLLGRDSRMQNVAREVAKLDEIPEAWKVDTTPNVEAWIQESHKLAKEFTYSPTIIAAVQREGDLTPINLPKEYLTESGRRARLQIVAAGLRLAVLLGAKIQPHVATVKDDGHPLPVDFKPAVGQTPTASGLTADSPAAKETYWLNTGTGIRHNSTCRNFGKTAHGRYCTAEEGKPCGICGG